MARIRNSDFLWLLDEIGTFLVLHHFEELNHWPHNVAMGVCLAGIDNGKLGKHAVKLLLCL